MDWVENDAGDERLFCFSWIELLQSEWIDMEVWSRINVYIHTSFLKVCLEEKME